VNLDHLHLYSSNLAQITRRALEDPHRVSDREIDEAFLEILSRLSLGSPFTFAEQHAGRIVQDIRPMETHEAERSSRGRIALDLHTDDAFLPREVRVEYLALCGIFNPTQIPTQVVRIEDVCERVQPETIEALAQPMFSFGCPQSYDIEKREEIWASPQPILKYRENGTVEVALPSTEVKVTEGAEPKAAHHLRLFKSALADAPHRQFELGAGEIIVISNSRCLHGRPAVEGERWLKRVYLRQDLTALNETAATETPGVYAAARAAGYER
jgi:L-asparagine oxygenase